MIYMQFLYTPRISENVYNGAFFYNLQKGAWANLILSTNTLVQPYDTMWQNVLSHQHYWQYLSLTVVLKVKF